MGEDYSYTRLVSNLMTNPDSREFLTELADRSSDYLGAIALKKDSAAAKSRLEESLKKIKAPASIDPKEFAQNLVSALYADRE
jgi:hypothetical protein